MNKNFKKIISLVLTVLMLAGTVTMLVPVSASEVSKTLTINTERDIKGVKVRLDAPDAHASSSLTLCPDGSVKMKGSRGDLFWLSNVELTAASVFTTTVTFDVAAAPNSCCAGTVYDIDANGAWNEDADTAIVAALRTFSGGNSRPKNKQRYSYRHYSIKVKWQRHKFADYCRC